MTRICDDLVRPNTIVRTQFGESFATDIGPMLGTTGGNSFGLDKAIRSCVRVFADECGSWYWGSERDCWELDKHFGPLRLPYDGMWIEWRIPRWIHFEGKWRDRRQVASDGPDRAGVFLLHRDADQLGWLQESVPKGCHEAICASVVGSSIEYGLEAQVGVMMVIFVDELGDYLDARIVCRRECDYWNLMSPLMDSVKVAALALGLMNCKNVSVSQNPGREYRKGGKRKIELAHHVIKLPGVQRPKNSKEAGAASGGEMPVHLVRGHFKTYTNEAPLFGRSTGTYWWSYHARGNQDNGWITKEYRT